MYQNQTFYPRDMESLERAGHLTAPSGSGTRWLHKRFLSNWNEEEYGDIPLDVDPNSLEAGVAFVRVPDRVISRATLEYVGFSETKAGDLWAQWPNWLAEDSTRETDPHRSGPPWRFLAFMEHALETKIQTFDEDDEVCTQVMDALGLSAKTKREILDPEWKYLRLGESCEYWARHNLKKQFFGLREIQRSSHERHQAIRLAALHFEGRD